MPKGIKGFVKGLKRSAEHIEKIVETRRKNESYVSWNKGQSMTHEGSFKKGHKGLSGENNPRWKGGINIEHERLRHSEKWQEWRNSVYKKDRWTCQERGYKGKDIVAHHIKLFSMYPDLRFEVSNGKTLCRSCHLITHRNSCTCN